MIESRLAANKIEAQPEFNPGTIYHWATRKGIPAEKFGLLWNFLASQVDEWAKGGLSARKPIGVDALKLLKSRSPKHLGH